MRDDANRYAVPRIMLGMGGAAALLSLSLTAAPAQAESQVAPGDGSAWTRGGECGRRVLRGGSWVYSLRGVRAAERLWFSSGVCSDDVGFRVARDMTAACIDCDEGPAPAAVVAALLSGKELLRIPLSARQPRWHCGRQDRFRSAVRAGARLLRGDPQTHIVVRGSEGNPEAHRNTWSPR